MKQITIASGKLPPSSLIARVVCTNEAGLTAERTGKLSQSWETKGPVISALSIARAGMGMPYDSSDT